MIFVLLYNNGQFSLSRNFRLQNIGDINWIERNYNFANVAQYIDELVVLNVSRSPESIDVFIGVLARLVKLCFIPIAAGGKVRCITDAKKLLDSGADKIVVNSLIWDDPGEVEAIASKTGEQCLIAALDVKERRPEEYIVFTHCGKEEKTKLRASLSLLNSLGTGEILLNSIDRDGTGQGFDLSCIEGVQNQIQQLKKPLIICGGAGNKEHFLTAFRQSAVDATATANLLNFVGNGLAKVRAYLYEQGVSLAQW